MANIVVSQHEVIGSLADFMVNGTTTHACWSDTTDSTMPITSDVALLSKAVAGDVVSVQIPSLIFSKTPTWLALYTNFAAATGAPVPRAARCSHFLSQDRAKVNLIFASMSFPVGSTGMVYTQNDFGSFFQFPDLQRRILSWPNLPTVVSGLFLQVDYTAIYDTLGAGPDAVNSNIELVF